jgi:hypothetical protein
LTTEFDEEVERILGKSAGRRINYQYLIVALLGVATSIVFLLAFAFFHSVSRLVETAKMGAQLSGTLIGFIAIADFYFLGSMNSLRERATRTLSAVSEGKSDTKGRESDEDILRISSSLDGICGRLGGFLLTTSVESIACFGMAVFVSMLAVATAIGVLAAVGLCFMILGIGIFSIALLDLQRMLNLLFKYMLLLEEALRGHGSISALREKLVGAPSSAT